MTGYCQNCRKIVEIDEVSTVRLPNMSFIHRGLCAAAACRGVVFVKIPDHEIIIDEAGHKCPAEVHAGPATPKKLVSGIFGQKVISKTGVVDTAKDIIKKNKTVSELKKELDDAKIK